MKTALFTLLLVTGISAQARTLSCVDRHTFNYARLTVQETATEFQITASSTQLRVKLGELVGETQRSFERVEFAIPKANSSIELSTKGTQIPMRLIAGDSIPLKLVRDDGQVITVNSVYAQFETLVREEQTVDEMRNVKSVVAELTLSAGNPDQPNVMDNGTHFQLKECRLTP